MTAASPLSRGRPMIVLGIIVAAWIGGRFALWEPAEMIAAPALMAADIGASPFMQPSPRMAGSSSGAAPDRSTAPLPELFAALAPKNGQQLRVPSRQAAWAAQPGNGYGEMPGEWSMLAVTHLVSTHGLYSANLPWTRFASNAAARGNGFPAARPAPASAILQDAHSAGAEPRRLSADGWLLWRGGGEAALGPGVPSYGRSQMGGALRYNIAPQTGYAPKLHLRASTAIAGEEERDLAAGLSARPSPQLPLRLAVEGRVTQTRLGTEMRGGAYAVSELPPVQLPGEITGEAYVQAGYVTGDFATPFVDGQARLSRQLAQSGDFRLAAGGGAWGGAQEGAARFDIGPTASVSFALGEAQFRLSADYRFRMAGDAAPDSGPALTLATGF